MGSIRQRKLWTVVLGVSLLLLFLLLAAQNAFKLTFLNPSTTGEIALFTTLSVVAFLLFLTALLLLVRNALRLYADQRSRVLGARLRTRMLAGRGAAFAAAHHVHVRLQLLAHESRGRALVLAARG